MRFEKIGIAFALSTAGIFKPAIDKEVNDR
jgi:hypothetical protein